MPDLLIISHPEVVVDPAIPIQDWRLSDTGRRRASDFATSPVFVGVTQIWTSAERKAADTAELLAGPGGLSVSVDHRLGENDRSATGFLPPAEFEAAADAFFARPEDSSRGWERAIDAQSRIEAAVREIVSGHDGGDLAICTHGGVGTLLWCAMKGVPISRRYDQPRQGHYWCANLSDLSPAHGWLPL